MCFMYIGAADRMSCNVTSSDSVVLETDDGEQLYISCTGKTICVQYSATGEQYEVIGVHQLIGDALDNFMFACIAVLFKTTKGYEDSH